MMRSVRTFLLIALSLALMAACGDESATGSESGRQPSDSTTAMPEEPTFDSEVADEPTTMVETEDTDSVVADGTGDAELDSLGYTPRDVGMLFQVGLSDGYAYDGADELEFALTMAYFCEAVADGTYTWPELVDSDIYDGAPPAAAHDFYDYLSNAFCPIGY